VYREGPTQRSVIVGSLANIRVTLGAVVPNVTTLDTLGLADFASVDGRYGLSEELHTVSIRGGSDRTQGFQPRISYAGQNLYCSMAPGGCSQNDYTLVRRFQPHLGRRR
jgi:hypothetical protein